VSGREASCNQDKLRKAKEHSMKNRIVRLFATTLLLGGVAIGTMGAGACWQVVLPSCHQPTQATVTMNCRWIGTPCCNAGEQCYCPDPAQDYVNSSSGGNVNNGACASVDTGLLYCYQDTPIPDACSWTETMWSCHVLAAQGCLPYAAIYPRTGPRTTVVAGGACPQG
jgi:hypothetical protein